MVINTKHWPYTMGTVSFPGVKRPGRGADPPPTSKCRGQERVGLYLYSLSGPSWAVMGAPLPLNNWPSDAWFPSYVKCVHLEVQRRHCTRDTSGTPLSPTTSDRNFLLHLTKSRSSAVAMCVDMQTVIVLRWVQNVPLTHIFSSWGSGILEQRVSVTMDRTRWTNSMDCSFPWFRSLKFSYLGTSEACCLCYRSQWCSEYATTNAGWIWKDSYETWNFPGSETVNVQTCNWLCWRSRWTLRIFL